MKIHEAGTPRSWKKHENEKPQKRKVMKQKKQLNRNILLNQEILNVLYETSYRYGMKSEILTPHTPKKKFVLHLLSRLC